MTTGTTVVLEWCLLAAIAAAIYPIVGYPLLLAVIGALRPRPVRRASFRPSVSVLIPAYNEAGCIGATIENKLGQDYPADCLEILVISDASEDGTDAIVAAYADRGVKLVRREKREGKAAALNEAVTRATGEVIVFSDANSTFATDAISRLIENFADPRVGYATGNLEYRHDGELSGRGSGAYMRYENWLRRLESRVGSVIGVNGGVDAMRRDLYRPVPASQITDFVLPLRVVAAGMRVIFDERAHSQEAANIEVAAEFRMRVRVALRALHGLVHVRAAFSRPLPAFCILSHKVLRYLSFAFLGLALALNVALAMHSSAFAILLLCQALFYALAIAGLSRRLPNEVRKVTALPTYFVMSNVAFGIAALRFVRGETMATWKPRAG